MIRRPPRSTPFPTRRSSDLMRVGLEDGREKTFSRFEMDHDFVYAPIRSGRRSRSEEHTSELQSQFHLVCRLLLEKKKKKKNTKKMKNKKNNINQQHTIKLES